MTKRKNRNFHPNKARSNDPMKEVLRITSLLNKIDVDKSVSEAVTKVNKANNEIIESTSFEVANKLLDSRTLVKKHDDSNRPKIDTYVEDGQVEVVNKPFVIGYLKDYGGCGHFRMIYPMNLINSRFSITGKINCTLYPKMVVQDDIIPHVRTIVFQRPIGEESVYTISAYKKFQKEFQYKLVAELDDYVFELPQYHPNFMRNTVEETRTLLLNLNTVDEVIVSTDNLKNELVKLGVTSLITVIENYLPKYLYQTDLRRFKLNNIVKPRIVYNGSDYHYNNEKNLEGDFEGNIKEFIISNIDNYEFIFFGNTPNFMKKYVDEGKVVVVPFTNPVEYATMLRRTRADFVIAPLVENVFNSCKSDLRYLEAASMGAIFIGSKFNGEFTSPYQGNTNTFDSTSSAEDINNIISKYLDKDVFNDELASQYEFLEGRWLENNNNIFKYVETYSSGIGGVQISTDHPQYADVAKILK